MKIYVGNNAIWEVPKYTFNDPHMGVRSIVMDLEHPAHLIDNTVTTPDFNGAYVEYDSEEYYISSAKPTGEKSNSNINYKYSLVFKGVEDELSHRKIRNLAQAGVDTFISQGTRFSIYADLNVFAQLIENNLDYYFDEEWTVNVIGTAPEVRLDIDNLTVLELLQKTYEYYGVRWRVSGRTINIGYATNTVPYIFDYGKVGGLAKISRTLPTDGVFNRVIGSGGTRNIPTNYFNNRHPEFPQDPDVISPDVNIKNLMPKAFRDSVQYNNLNPLDKKPLVDYAEDAVLIAEQGVRETALAPNEEIYPSIAGVEKPVIGRIDQIIAYEEIDERTFNIWVKDIGFDLADNQYTTTEEAKISFTSGLIAGYEFVILAYNGVREVVEDTTKSHGGVSSKYKITLIKSEEDADIGRPYIPYDGLEPNPGDSFVIYHIEMPFEYVLNAEERLQGWLDNQLAEIKVEKPSYVIEPYDSFLDVNSDLLNDLISGNKIVVNNDTLVPDPLELYISRVSVEYGVNIVPKYTIVVSDRVEIEGTTIGRLSAKIDGIENRQYFSLQEIKEIVDGLDLGRFRGEIARNYLSKVNPDTAQKIITFASGLQSNDTSTFNALVKFLSKAEFKGNVDLEQGAAFGNFITGLLGSGAKIDEYGHGEFDSVSIRKFLEVPELRYNRVNVYTGIRWDTFGAGLIESVEIDTDGSGNQLNTGTITLKLEDGEYGAIAEDDLCQGIFHNFGGSNDTVNEDQQNGNFRFMGFNTVYFRVIEILDTQTNGVFRYQLRTVGDNWYQQHHPQAFMTFAAYANPYNTDRQASTYTTTDYTIRLRNMTDWEYGEANIYGITGKLDGFKMGETIFHGHGSVMGNAYLYGTLQGIEDIIRDQIQVGGKNLLREHALQFGGKYWGGGAEWKDIDIDTLIELLVAENNNLIVTENNMLIEF